MKKSTILIPVETIEKTIRVIRGQRVVLDNDLARICGVSTFRLNEQVKRNSKRFPDDFLFQLTRQEFRGLISQSAMSKTGRGGRRTLPYAFTEHGAIMAANVLNSDRAATMSVYVVRAFIRMRDTLAATTVLEKRLAEIEKSLLSHDSALRDLYQKIRPLLLPPPDPPHKSVGFQIKERRAAYRVR